ncbi:MAG: DUF1353 domain-containing protein [Dehalococcoidales bacterium]
MTIANVTFETNLHTIEYIAAVRKNGVKVEGVLTAPFVITFDWNDGRWKLSLPMGYAAAPSVPPFLRSFAPATGGLRWGSFPHDWIREHQVISLADGDELLAEIMKAAGDGWFKRQRVWLSVRAQAQFEPDFRPTLKGLTKIGKANG